MSEIFSNAWSWLKYRARHGLNTSVYGKDPNGYNEYYEVAFYDLLRDLWRGTEFANIDEDISSMSYYKALRSYYEKTRAAIRDRRRILFSYCLPAYSKDGSEGGLKWNSLLRKRYPDLPIFNAIPRALNLLCVLYDIQPIRTFYKNETKEKDFQKLYEASKLIALFPEIYERLTYMSLQLMRLIYRLDAITNELRPIIELWFPDQFRYKTDGIRITELEYIDTDTDGSIIYWFWNTEVWEKRKPKNRRFNKTGEFELLDKGDNRYGFVPFLALNFSLSNEKYPAGMFELFEGQVEGNSLRFEATSDANYNVNPNKMYKNVPVNQIPTAADDVTVMLGITEGGPGQEIEPSFERDEPNPIFDEIEGFADGRQALFMTNESIPVSKITSENIPQSGIAKAIDEDELTQKRTNDIPLIRLIEKEVADYVARISDIENGTKFGELDNFAIQYQPTPILLSPLESYEFDKTKTRNLDMDIVVFKRKHAGYNQNIDEAAAITENDRRFDSLAKFKTPVPEPEDGDEPKKEGDEDPPNDKGLQEARAGIVAKAKKIT